MEETIIKGGDGYIDLRKDKKFIVSKKKDFTSWVCFYKEENNDDTYKLYEGLAATAPLYGIKVNKPKKEDWIMMADYASAEDWEYEAEQIFKKNKNQD